MISKMSDVDAWLSKESYGITNAIWVIIVIIAAVIVWRMLANKHNKCKHNESFRNESFRNESFHKPPPLVQETTVSDVSLNYITTDNGPKFTLEWAGDPRETYSYYIFALNYRKPFYQLAAGVAGSERHIEKELLMSVYDVLNSQRYYPDNAIVEISAGPGDSFARVVQINYYDETTKKRRRD